MHNLEKLSPFKYYIMTSFPYIEEDFDALTNYELFCKVTEYLNDILTSQNNVIDNFNEINADWLETKAYIDDYFDNLDVQEEIDNKLDEMATDGSLSDLIRPLINAVMPALVVSSTAAMTDTNRSYILSSNSHVYQYQNDSWVDTGIVYGSTIGNVVSYISALDTNADLDNLSTQTIYIRETDSVVSNAPTSKAGFVYTYGIENRTSQQIYTEFVSGLSWYRRRTTSGNWSNWGSSDLKYLGAITADTYPDLDDLLPQTIMMRTSGTTIVHTPTDDQGLVYTYGIENSIRWQMYYSYTGKQYFRYSNPQGTYGDWANNEHQWLGFIANGQDLNQLESNTMYLCRQNYALNAPTNLTGFIETIGTPAGFAFQRYTDYKGNTYFRYRNNAGTWGTWTNTKVQYFGSLANNFDLDNIEVQSIWFRSTNITGSNAPITEAGIIYTFGAPGLSKQQFYVRFSDGLIYYRTYSSADQSWNAWMSTFTDKSNAKLLSVTNSILTGSVWIEGSIDHLVSKEFAPYAICGRAMNIADNNIDHTLIDGGGFMHPGSNSNYFLNKILSTDISDYDAILTHFYTRDLDDYNVGTVNATANDGTLAGGVVALINYIKNNNAKCQLIIASVVPVNYNSGFYGDNVFTAVYPDGSSINDFNTVMEGLAEKYHFKFIKWNDLNLSYVWQDYTDGDNVHANSDTVYRALGAYLGGHAAEYCNF